MSRGERVGESADLSRRVRQCSQSSKKEDFFPFFLRTHASKQASTHASKQASILSAHPFLLRWLQGYNVFGCACLDTCVVSTLSSLLACTYARTDFEAKTETPFT